MSNIMLFLSEIADNVSWKFSLENYGEVWGFLVQMGLVLIFLLIGNLLRTTVPFIKKSLIPSALLGGLLFLLCKEASGFINGIILPIDGGFNAYCGV